MYTSEERGEREGETDITCAVYVQVQVQVHIQLIINLICIYTGFYPGVTTLHSGLAIANTSVCRLSVCLSVCATSSQCEIVTKFH